MAIECACPQCPTRFVVPDHFAGRTAVCPQCGGAIVVPGAVRQHVLLTPQGEPPSPGPGSPAGPSPAGASTPLAQGYPAHAYPAPWYPVPGYPPQSGPAQPFPAQPYAGQPYPAQAYAPQGYAAPDYPAPGHPAQGSPAIAYPAQSPPGDATAAAAPAAPAGQSWPAGAPAFSLLEGLSGESTQAGWAAGAASPTFAESAATPSGVDKQVSGARGNVRLSARAALMVFSAGAVALFAMIVLTLPKVGWFFALLLALAGGAVIFSGLAWNHYVAMRESMGTAMWSMLCPPYTIYFLLTRWDRTRKASWVIALGVGLTTGGVLSMLHARNLIAQRSAKPGKSTAGSPHTTKREPTRTVTSSGSGATTAKPSAAAAPAPKPAVAATSPTPTKIPASKPTKPRRDPDDIEPATDLLTPPTFEKTPGAAPAGNSMPK